VDVARRRDELVSRPLSGHAAAVSSTRLDVAHVSPEVTMRSMTVGSGTGAVNAVVLASAIVPPLVVLLVFRIGWTWSQNDHGDERLSLRQLMRRAFWFERQKRTPRDG
jgi:hypothetical protein